MQLKKVLANSAGNGSAFAARQLNADSSSNINIKTRTRLLFHFLPPCSDNEDKTPAWRAANVHSYK